jgi:hypothetical protein
MAMAMLQVWLRKRRTAAEKAELGREERRPGAQAPEARAQHSGAAIPEPGKSPEPAPHGGADSSPFTKPAHVAGSATVAAASWPPLTTTIVTIATITIILILILITLIIILILITLITIIIRGRGGGGTGGGVDFRVSGGFLVLGFLLRGVLFYTLPPARWLLDRNRN